MSDVNLSISSEVVQPIIEAKVNAAVCEALSGAESIVANVVARVLSEKVDSDSGKPSRYGGDRDPTFIRWLCGESIRLAARQAVVNYINSSNERVIAEIEKCLQKNTKVIAVNLVNSFVKATESEYRMKIDVSAILRDRN